MTFNKDKPAEEFPLAAEPLDGSPIPEPEQLQLSPKPKTPGHFTREANKLIRRHQKGGDPNDR